MDFDHALTPPSRADMGYVDRSTLLSCFAGTVLIPSLAAAQPVAPAAQRPQGFQFLPTAYLNQEMPNWLRFSAEERVRLEGFLGANFHPDSSDAYILNRLRVGMSATPTSWLQLRVQLQDARVFGKNAKPYAPPYQDTLDLRQAYVEIGDSEQRLASVRFGRQDINLGDERLVGSAGWANAARSFDAVRLSLHHGHYRLDAFSASPVMLHDGDVGDHLPGNNLHGLYAGFEELVPRSRVEPYVFWRLNPRQRTESGALGNLDFSVVGVRWVGNLPARFSYGMEVAREQGSLGTDSIGSWAGHWVVSRLVARRGTPKLSVELNYATGDHDPADGHRGGFDQLFASVHEKYSTTDQVGWKNTVQTRSGLEFRPAAKWTLAFKGGAYWLADAHDALYNTTGTSVCRRVDGSAGRFVGSELDVIGSYAISKQLQFATGVGHLFPGRFLKLTTPGTGYTYPYLTLTAIL